MTDTLKSQDTDEILVEEYELEKQIGFLLRRAHQRHISIFAEHMHNGLTPQQFAVLMRLREAGQLSQNELGRQAAMDQSTINGVVQRLFKRGFLQKNSSATDKRMILLELTETGLTTLLEVMEAATEISKETLKPLKPQQRQTLLRLLHKIC